MTKTKESGIVYNAPNVRLWRDEGNFIIPEVIYRGKTGTYRLFEQMTPAMNQEQLLKFYEQEKTKGNPHPTDAPLIWAICTSAYTLKNENPKTSEKLRNFLQTGFQEYSNTLTRIIYNPSEKDKIVHNHGTSDEYSIDEHIVGRDCWIRNMSNKKVLESLLGTSNIKQIDEVSQWINKTNTYIWRPNLKTRTKEEKVARFYAEEDGRFIFDFCGSPFIRGPAFRVLKG